MFTSDDRRHVIQSTHTPLEKRCNEVDSVGDPFLLRCHPRGIFGQSETLNQGARRAAGGRLGRSPERPGRKRHRPAQPSKLVSEGPRRSILGLPLGSCIGSSISGGRCVRFADENETVYCSCAIGHSHYHGKQAHRIVSI